MINRFQVKDRVRNKVYKTNGTVVEIINDQHVAVQYDNDEFVAATPTDQLRKIKASRPVPKWSVIK